MNFGNDIDPILREEIGKEFPKENVWAVIDEQGGKDYQDKIFQKIEKAEINKEQAKEKETKQEKEKDHISNIETQEQKPELTRFEQAKLNREAKQGQEQEQEKKRGFRR